MITALLGKRDFPTDGVEDYCRLLGEALTAQGTEYTLERVRWDQVGWSRALGQLWRLSAAWKGQWVLAQYTALSWSQHGFPLLFLLVLLVLRGRRASIAVVFHDAGCYSGKRLIDGLRRACQHFVIRSAYRLSNASILTIPLEQAPWLPPGPSKAVFIPIGANVPAESTSIKDRLDGHEARTIAVFGVTGGGSVGNEVSDIAFAAKAAAERIPGVRLLTLGRGSLESESRFHQALRSSAVEYHALGVLPAGEISRVLAGSDVSLFVRGPLSTNRGSAIASIACGLPVVAYAPSHLPAPLAEAGVVGVRYADARALAEATVRVLTDDQLRCDLRERSRRAHERYFCWEIVAAHYLAVLSDA